MGEVVGDGGGSGGVLGLYVFTSAMTVSPKTGTPWKRVRTEFAPMGFEPATLGS